MTSPSFDPSALARNVLAAYASPFTQSRRIVQLALAGGSAPDTLLAHRVIGHEVINNSYRVTVEALSADSFIESKELLGQGAAIKVRTADGDERIVTGVVTQVGFGGMNGGLTRYFLQIEPLLATLAHRTNSRTFQDKTVIDIVTAILQEHIERNPVFAKYFALDNKVNKTYPTRSYCQQYQETDLAFITRLLAEEGISFYWTYSNDDDVPVHTMTLFDDAYTLEEAMHPQYRYHRSDGTENQDSIIRWESARQIGPGLTTLGTWDYKRAATYGGSEQSSIHQGDHGNDLAGTLESYHHQAPYYGADETEMARYALLRQQAGDMQTKISTGVGTPRGLGAGRYFELSDHPVIDHDYQEDRQFVVLSLDWVAENNLPSDTSNALRTLFPQASMQRLAADANADARLVALLATGAASASAAGKPAQPYQCTFDAVRRGIAIVPAYDRTQHAKPTAPGLQTAIVTGPAGEEIFTDEHGRIKVQFPWQRPQDHPEGNAAHDDKSSTWIRVAPPSADAGWGMQHIPRVGSEVLIAFIENDIDRPICIGGIHNGLRTPPAFSGAGSLPGNKALSGTKTKEYKGSQYNELLFDDTTGELRTKLSSEHAKTQLNQGYLIHPRTEGKGEPRGEGFELRTDTAGAIRAAKGLLLTAEAQSRAGGKQLARTDILQMLDAALAMAEQLGEHAAHQHANLPETGKDNQLTDDDATPGKPSERGHQTHLKEAIENLERGSNTDKEGKSGNGKQPGRQGIVAVTAPDGIAMTTPGSATIAAGTNLDQIALRDTNQTTGRRWIHNAAESISLFVSGTKAKIKDTLKLIAAKGNMQVQAQDGEIAATAQKDVTITSVNGKVVIQAPKEILLAAGGGYIRIGKDIEIHNPGKQSQKAAGFALNGPESMSPMLPSLPQGEIKPADLVVRHIYHDDEAVHGAKYIAAFADGSKRDGFTDAEGMLRLENVPPGAVRVRFGADGRPYDAIEYEKNPGHKATLSDDDLDAFYARHGGAQ